MIVGFTFVTKCCFTSEANICFNFKPIHKYDWKQKNACFMFETKCFIKDCYIETKQKWFLSLTVVA